MNKKEIAEAQALIDAGLNGSPDLDVEAVFPEKPDDLVVEIARELYDRFVMGGWEPQDAYGSIVIWLARARAAHPESRGATLIAEPEKSKPTTFVCDCGRKLLVDGQVIGKELAAPPSSPVAPQTQCPTCQSIDPKLRQRLYHPTEDAACFDNWHDQPIAGQK